MPTARTAAPTELPPPCYSPSSSTSHHPPTAPHNDPANARTSCQSTENLVDVDGGGDDGERKKASWVPRTHYGRAYLLACAAGLVADPLFLYAVSVSAPLMCVFLDGWLAAAVTALRSAVDLVNAARLVGRLRGGAGASRRAPDVEVGEGEEVGRPYAASLQGLWLDIFVLLPLMQVATWIAAPALIRRGSTTAAMAVLLIFFLVDYIPKIHHSVCFLRRTQNLWGTTGRRGLALNLTVYFLAAHAVGACWYLLGAQRAAKCLKEQCAQSLGCRCSALACVEPIYYGASVAISRDRTDWAKNETARSVCLGSGVSYQYGVYKMTAGLVGNPSRVEKILLPIFWGLMTLSTFGNLESTTEWTEIVFNIVTITAGLLLVTMLIGNLNVFLPVTSSKKQAMQLRLRSVEWWMRRKQLPQGIRQRVRQYERQRWAAARGVDEGEMVRHLPEGLRRDIKYHLCLDLVRQVPVFHHMDALVLDNICDRVTSLIFPKGEIVIREGDPVRRMLFVVRGHLQSSQVLRNGVESRCMLGPGNFSGDELLSWCLCRPFRERLPPSSSTLVALESTEAFGLLAEDVKYVTRHFRYTFLNEKVRRSARYYSPGWRTWAAVAVQLAWRRFKHRKTLTSLSFIRPRRPLSRCNSAAEEKLRLYAALLTSPKPDQDDFLF